MHVIVGIRKRGSPYLRWDYHYEWDFEWDCIPRLGDLFVSPVDETEEDDKIKHYEERAYKVQRVWWLPVDIGNDRPTVRVDVEEFLG